MKMKRKGIAAALLSVLMAAFMLAGCGSSARETGDARESTKAEEVRESTKAEEARESTKAEETQESIKAEEAAVDSMDAEAEFIAQLSGIDLSAFETVDLNGNTVTQDIFRDHDVTMVNLWQTWCGPCRAEMPEIQKAYENLPENANIVSICMDGAQEEELAKAIVEKSGLECTVLVMNDELAQKIEKYVLAFPTTIFVDSEGHMTGTPIIGVPVNGNDVAQAYLDALDGIS